MKLKIVDILTNQNSIETDEGPLGYGPWEEVKVVVGNVRTGQAVTISNTEYEAWYEPVEAWQVPDWDRFTEWLEDQELEGSDDMGRLFIQAIEKFNELNKEKNND